MYKNSDSHSMMVSAERKKAFWCHGAHYAGYRSYTVDQLLHALKFILKNTFVQFAGNIFKQIQGIPMGGNASPFIADLYLAWHEYCFMEELHKSKLAADQTLIRSLSLNSRYIDDIAVVNLLNFDAVANKIYDPSLILENSKSGYHYDTFLDLLIRVYKKRFVIGIYHKVDDFNFTVINFPFPESNIHSRVGYNAFYSQLVRFFRLCNNLPDFLARVKMIYVKLYERGYSSNTLYRYFVKFCAKYSVLLKYSVRDVQSLWSMSIEYRSGISCVIYDGNAVDDIVKPCNVILQDIYGNIKSKYKSILKSCKVCLSKTESNIKHFAENVDENINSKHSTDRDNCNEITNDNHLPPQGLLNPSNHCYINSVLQVVSRVLTTLNIDIHFNNNHEGKLMRALFESTKEVRNLNYVKSLFGKFHNFFNGSRQQDAHECLMLLFDVFHEGTKFSLLLGVDDEESVISLKKQLFQFSLYHQFKCVKCEINSSHYSHNYFHNINPKFKHKLTDLLNYSLTNERTKMCNFCHTNTLHNEVINFMHLPKVITIVVNRFDYTDIGRKNRTPILLEKHIQLNSSKYSLIASIQHQNHKSCSSSGHYTSTVFYPDVVYHCNDNYIQIHNFEEISDDVYIVLYACDD
jgi:ubiquitin C-terminal hydrolase